MAEILERDLYAPIIEWLTARGCVALGEEVKTHGRSRADLTVLLPDHGVLTVEVKVKDWRRAVHQALMNRYCAHESWIAVWWSSINGACEEACRTHGVGLLSVEGGLCQQLIASTRSYPHIALVERIRTQLAG